MVKQRYEGVANAVNLAAAVESDVFGREFAIQRQIARCACRGDAEARHQVRAANLAEEVKAEVDISEAFALCQA